MKKQSYEKVTIVQKKRLRYFYTRWTNIVNKPIILTSGELSTCNCDSFKRGTQFILKQLKEELQL